MRYVSVSAPSCRILNSQGPVVTGGAAYANRNPLFRSPARNRILDGKMHPLDDTATSDTTTTSDRSTDVSTTSLGQRQRPWPLVRDGNRGRGNRAALHHQSPRDIVDDYNDDDEGSISRLSVSSRGATRMSDLSFPLKAGIAQQHNNTSARGRGVAHNDSTRSTDKAQQPPFRSPRRAREHVIDDRNLSDITEMLVVQKPSTRNAGVDRYSDVAGVGGIGGGGGGDIGSSTHSLGGAGATGKGIEPAVKGCGCMTTSTFAKLVRLREFF